MTTYYNEHEPFAAQWLRNLIAEGMIAPGDVDERDIRDVLPSDIMGYRQCHFFAGIGVWSYALRLAGWPDDRTVWTGSCPCQPFSAAGRRGGTADERHLWPSFFHLIRECRPPVVFGEQVSSKDGLAWLDTVQSDLEGEAYSVGALDTCAAGVGAPHIRQRLYFVADSDLSRAARQRQHGRESTPEEGLRNGPAHRGGAVVLADAAGAGPLPRSHAAVSGEEAGRAQQRGRDGGRPAGRGGAGFVADTALRVVDGGKRAERNGSRDGSANGGSGRVADAGCAHGERGPCGRSSRGQDPAERGEEGSLVERGGVDVVLGNPGGAGLPPCERSAVLGAGRREEGREPLQSGGSFWTDVEWLPCRDGKARPTQPGLRVLAHRTTNRVGKLRGYGNALVAPQAAEFVAAYLEARGLK